MRIRQVLRNVASYDHCFLKLIVRVVAVTRHGLFRIGECGSGRERPPVRQHLVPARPESVVVGDIGPEVIEIQGDIEPRPKSSLVDLALPSARSAQLGNGRRPERPVEQEAAGCGIVSKVGLREVVWVV